MPINIDPSPVLNGAEAEALMLHHLMLAAMYFEATKNDAGRSIISKLHDRVAARTFPCMAETAAKNFILHLVTAYKG